MDLLEVQNICKTYGSGEAAVHALKNASFTVPKGAFVAVVGESGSGKSVTMMALMGLIDAPGRITADALTFNGSDMLTLSGR